MILIWPLVIVYVVILITPFINKGLRIVNKYSNKTDVVYDETSLVDVLSKLSGDNITNKIPQTYNQFESGDNNDAIVSSCDMSYYSSDSDNTDNYQENSIIYNNNNNNNLIIKKKKQISIPQLQLSSIKGSIDSGDSYTIEQLKTVTTRVRIDTHRSNNSTFSSDHSDGNRFSSDSSSENQENRDIQFTNLSDVRNDFDDDHRDKDKMLDNDYLNNDHVNYSSTEEIDLN